jgi:hypothetical protein
VKSFSDPLEKEKEKEITIENFHEVLQNSTPKIEKAFEMPKAPGTFKSKLVVRLQFILRKLFRR